MRWFPRLNASYTDGLLRNTKRGIDSLIICRQGDQYRGFGLFSPLYTFGTFILKTKKEDRCFYEVIEGNSCQKPYFDIDISDSDITKEDSMILINTLKNSILEDSRIKEEDILVFSSHGDIKLSYHIVVNRWCLPDYISNKIYCHKIIDRIPNSFTMKGYIDSLVYKSVQQFRTFGSTKRGKERFKVLDGVDIDSTTNRFEFMKILYESLITNTRSCRIMEYSEPIKKVYSGELKDITSEEMSIIENLDIIKDGIFDISDVKGRLVPLKRKKPSFCGVCERDHENENPFLIFGTDEISFHCRRISKGNIIIWRKPIETVEIPIKTKQISRSEFMKKFLGKK